MRIKKGENVIDIPSWMLVIGILAVDNIVANICRSKALKDITKKRKG